MDNEDGLALHCGRVAALQAVYTAPKVYKHDIRPLCGDYKSADIDAHAVMYRTSQTGKRGLVSHLYT